MEQACSIAVPKAIYEAGLRAEEISCVGLSGQMHGAVMLDEQSEVVRPALIWCDVRTEKQSRELTQRLGAERLIRLTCNPALTNFTLTKFLWVREVEPENWKRVRSVMLLALTMYVSGSLASGQLMWRMRLERCCWTLQTGVGHRNYCKRWKSTIDCCRHSTNRQTSAHGFRGRALQRRAFAQARRLWPAPVARLRVQLGWGLLLLEL